MLLPEGFIQGSIVGQPLACLYYCNYAMASYLTYLGGCFPAMSCTPYTLPVTIGCSQNAGPGALVIFIFFPKIHLWLMCMAQQQLTL